MELGLSAAKTRNSVTVRPVARGCSLRNSSSSPELQNLALKAFGAHGRYRTVASGGALVQNTLVMVRGCRIAANNGLKVVGAGSTGTSIVITGGMTAETFAATDHVTVEVCGFRFSSGDLRISGSGTTLITTTKDLTQLPIVSGQMCWLGGGSDNTSAQPPAAS